MKAALTLATIVLAASLARAGQEVELIQNLEAPERHCALERETGRAEQGVDIEVEIPDLPDERQLVVDEFDRDPDDFYRMRPPVEHDGLNWPPFESQYPSVEFDGTHPRSYKPMLPPVKSDGTHPRSYRPMQPPVKSDGTHPRSYKPMLPPVEFDGNHPWSYRPMQPPVEFDGYHPPLRRMLPPVATY